MSAQKGLEEVCIVQVPESWWGVGGVKGAVMVVVVMVVRELCVEGRQSDRVDFVGGDGRSWCKLLLRLRLSLWSAMVAMM